MLSEEMKTQKSLRWIAIWTHKSKFKSLTSLLENYNNKRTQV